MVVHNEREALCVAVEMERRAIRMYERALLLVEDEAVRKGIESILQQERRHLSSFIKMRESHPASAEEESLLVQAMGAEALFPGGVIQMERSQGLTSLAGLYSFAIDSEQHAMETYRSFAEKCQDSSVSEIFRIIAEEESAHLVSLRNAELQ